MTKQRLLPIAFMLALLPSIAAAQEGRFDVADRGDTAWVLAASLLGMLALPGHAMFSAGRVRFKNVLSVVVQCGAIFALVSILWAMVGYTLAFGTIAGGWIGSGNAWMLISLGNVRQASDVPESGFAFLQMVLAMLAPTLMVGAWAERARLGWVVIFAGLWSLVVYAPIAHWMWGDGWLSSKVGALDWAGGIVVHTSAGVSALVVAVMLGHRKGISLAKTQPHSPAITALGAFVAWIGWLALTGAWALAANDDASAAVIAIHLASASCALGWLLLERVHAGKPTAVGFASGAIAGMAAASPAAGYISPGAAIILGLSSALACYYAAQFTRRTLQVDDALGVFALHGVAGIFGSLILAPLMSHKLGGVGHPAGMDTLSQLVAQALAVLVVVAWSAMGSVILALMSTLAFPMRVSEDAEREGLDASSHGERGWTAD